MGGQGAGGLGLRGWCRELEWGRGPALHPVFSLDLQLVSLSSSFLCLGFLVS